MSLMVKWLPESRELFLVRWGGIAGIFTPIFAFTFIGLAIATYPQFNWFNNALSDLGVVPGITESLFNFGLLVSGLLTFNFAIGLYKFLSNHVTGKIGAVIFAAASLSLIGIGSAPENARPFHYIFSVAFFALMPIALLTIAGYNLATHRKRMAAFTFLVAIVAALPWLIQFSMQPFSGVAIPELVSALAGSCWTVLLAHRMFKQASLPRTD